MLLQSLFLFSILVPKAVSDVPAKTSAGIDTLFHLRNMFYIEDVDDDLMVEFDDIYQVFMRADVNNDGIYSYEEMISDPDFDEANGDDIKVFDVDGDGIVTMTDVHYKFYDLLGACGNDINMYEYLQFMSTREPDNGQIVSIRDFAIGENNFQICDLNDNGVVTLFEFRTEFRSADDNRNDIMESNEIDAFRPARYAPPCNVCQTANTTGCTWEDVKPLFSMIDADGDGLWSLKEYVTAYTTMIMTNDVECI